MKWIFKRQGELERAFRAGRERPSGELVQRIEARVNDEARRAEPRRPFRLVAPVLMTAVLLVSLAAVGGVSYAATNIQSAATAVTHVFGLKSSKHVSVSGGAAVATSGHDQYRSGYGWGATSHTHTGAPGIGQAGDLVPPPLGKILGPTVYVTSTFTIDEQAHLWVSVIDEDGTEYLITQTKSHIGHGIHGVQAKNINYLVLIPRTIPIRLAIPKNLLIPGHHYRIRIIARAPNFEQKTLYIGFVMPKP